jgi:uncharacterized membrane protein (DUF485 family)
MKKYIKQLTVIWSLMMVFAYLIISFIDLNLNFLNWCYQTRLEFVVLSVAFIVMSFILVGIYRDSTKNEKHE